MILLLAWLWLAAAAGAGRTVLRLVRVQPRGRLEALLLSLSLGFALCSYLIFAFGMSGWLTPIMAWTVFMALFITGLPSWWDLVVVGRPQLWAERSSLWPQLGPGRWLVLGLAGFGLLTAGLNLIGALAPPTHPDILSYHLALPAYYLRQGSISFVPFYKDWGSPFTAEMWNLLGLLLGSERLPQVFQWCWGLISAGVLYMLAAERISRRVGGLAAIVYYTSPHIFQLSTAAKSDLVWQTFLFLSLHTLLAWNNRRDAGWLWLSAAFTGLAMATKYQGLFWAPAIGLALLVSQGSDWGRIPWRAFWRSISYGAISVLVVSPWWLRNWFASGDPVWPFGYPIFHSRFWTQELNDKYAAWTQGPGDSLWYYFTGLWNLSLNQSAYSSGMLIPVTPLLLAFLPGLILVWPSVPAHTRRFFGMILITSSVYYTFWFTTYQQTRYAFPIFALLMILAAYSFWQITRFSCSSWVATSLLSLSLMMFLSYNFLFNIQVAPVVFGLETRQSFLARRVSFYEDFVWANDNLPGHAHVLFFHLKPYYLDRPYILGTRNLWLLDGQTTADEYLSLMGEQKITHIFRTGLWEADSENADSLRLITQLKKSGSLKSIYFNVRGVQVHSRTLNRLSHTTVEILQVVYE